MYKVARFAFMLILLAAVSNICFAGTVRFDICFDADKVRMEPYKDYYRISYSDPNAYSLAKEGEPDIPAYMIRVLVPAECEVKDIILDERDRVILGEMIPYPFQGYEIISKPRFSEIGADPSVYKSGKVYPSSRIVFHSIEKTRGFNILYFSYYPFIYDTNTGQLSLYQDVSFEVLCSYKKEKSPVYYRPNSVFNDIISRSVVNPADIAIFYPEKMNPVRAKTDYDMLIITTSTFESAAQSYATFRAGAGISSDIITVSEITSAYSGSTTQMKIKNCIYDYVQNNNITYVFLIGDGGTSSTYSVHDQNLYGYLDFAKETDNTLPGDVFYSCFDDQFDWNADGDSYVGEMSGDNADISPDVIIGRLAVRESQQILDYMAKVGEYIDAASDSSFPKNLLLSGVQLFYYSGDAEAKSEVMYSDFIEPYWSGHNKNTLYDTNATVSVATLSALLNQGMNFFHMATHGNVTIWAMESGSDFTSSSALALDNIPGIVVTIACITNAFDPEVSGASDPCLGEAFIRNADGGAVAYLGASRYGIGYNSYDTHGPSFQYNDWIFRYTLDTTYQNIVGAGFTQAKIQMTGSADSDYAFRWVHFALNHLGDPSITAHKDVQSNISAPSNLQATAVSSSQVNLTWTDNSDNETGFKVDRKTGSSGTWSQAGTVGANVSSYQDSGLSANTSYYYRVRAYNASENSAYSNEANVFTHSMPLGEALDNTSLVWSTSSSAGGEYVWYGQSDNYYYGGSSARSGAIGNNSTTTLSTEVTGPGTLTFHWKVSSEDDYDYLRFYINSTEMDAICGVVDWQEKTYEIEEGTNVLEWVYDKDEYVEENDDTGWVDYVRWEPDIVSENAVISIEDEGAEGLYTWSYSQSKPITLKTKGSTWSNIFSGSTASRIEAGDITGDGILEFVALIPGFGLYYYDQNTMQWTNIAVYDTIDFTLAKTAAGPKKEVIASFTSYGLYRFNYDTSSWSNIIQYPADMLHAVDMDRDADSIDELIATFDGIERLYLYDFSAGSFTTILMAKPLDVAAADITGDGYNEMACVFSGIGIYMVRYIPDKDLSFELKKSIYEKYQIIDLAKDIRSDHTWISKGGDSKGLQWNRILIATPTKGHPIATGDIAGDSGCEVVITYQDNVYYYAYSTLEWTVLANGSYKRILAGKFTGYDKDDLIMCSTSSGALYLWKTSSAEFELMTSTGNTNAMAVIR